MQLKINNESVEFELSKNTKNDDVLFGINIKREYDFDTMNISITLSKDEFIQLQELVGGK